MNVIERIKMDNNEEMLTATSGNENATTAPTGDAEYKSHKRILLGKVSSNKADKTIIVSVVRQIIHPLYKKYYKRTNRFMAHDPENTCRPGDIVKIKECRPLSAKKRWTLIEIVERAK